MKRKGMIRLLAILTVMTMITTLGTAFAAAENEKTTLSATEAPEWTALFDRRGEKKTWLGADGIYSVALDGNDAFGSATPSTNTFFIFSDTLMGYANADGNVPLQASMPAQSSALLSGNIADKNAIEFVFGNGGNGTLGEHLFGEHKWMLDAFVIGDKLHILGFPEQGWKPKQIDMITMPIAEGKPVYSEYKETEKITQLWHKIGEQYLYAYGVGVTCNTESAGAPDPDGYVYIYGYRDAMQEWSRKDLIVGRILESDFPDFSKFTYWNGENWGKNIEESAVLLTDVSCELSVSPIPTGPYAGKYIAVYTQYTRSNNIMYAIGDTPYGPFDTPVKCYHAPEHGEVGASGSGTRVVYNAKAHPHLSSGDKLLISYNVNVEGQGVKQWTTDYHPRFLWLDLDPTSEPTPDTTVAPDSTKAPDTTVTPDTQAPETPDTSDKAEDKKPISPLPFILTAAALSAAAIGIGVYLFIKKKKK